jgi:hypothetical protein
LPDKYSGLHTMGLCSFIKQIRIVPAEAREEMPAPSFETFQVVKPEEVPVVKKRGRKPNPISKRN